jgi:predicted nuclease of predicted toxin-antitoxin system
MGCFFVCDVNIPRQLPAYLRIKGHDGVHALDLGFGQAEDSDIGRYAADRNAIIITKDADFVVLATAKPGPRVLRVCLGNCSNQQLLHRLERDLAMILDRFDTGSRLVELNW